MRVSVSSARTSLPSLIEAAMAGAPVIIAGDDARAVRLVPTTSPDHPKLPFRLGHLRGQVPGPVPDFLSPPAEEEVQGWEGRGYQN